MVNSLRMVRPVVLIAFTLVSVLTSAIATEVISRIERADAPRVLWNGR